MILELNGLSVECVIGDRPSERTQPQRLLVDVRLEIDETVSESDALEDTVDYAALTEKIREALAKSQCRMIERAAKVVCDLCREDPKVRAATVRIVKAGAVAHLASAAATYSSPSYGIIHAP